MCLEKMSDPPSHDTKHSLLFSSYLPHLRSNLI
uniref:Uncharacterized protein n=1 Tax=Anguilla anguilla TaxID=7936 RepID=A0A0E9P560_ANGAN